MSEIRIRPRSSIVDPDRARAAVVDLPTAARTLRRPLSGQDLTEALAAVAALRRPSEPERVIVLSLAPVPVRARR